MNENKLNQPEDGENREDNQPEIIVNEYGATRDSAVVVEEEDRTVLLTENETIVIEKQPSIDIVPKNRPRKVYAGMWGQAEIATVGVGMLAILTTILLFIFLVLPAQKELAQNREERDRIERDLTTAKSRYGSITSTETQVAKLVTSVTDFETGFLPNAALGRTALYQRINGLIGAYGLTNTTGPDYAPLEIADNGNNQSSGKESGRSKFQSIFPGVYVTMTVEGSYQNLRRFIREVETSDQFVVISAVELEPTENKERQPDASAPPQAGNPVNNPAGGYSSSQTYGMTTVPSQPQMAQPVSQAPAARGKTHGEMVSLRLEMAAYFRRPNFAAPAPENETPNQ